MFSTMAAILNLPEEKVEQICIEVQKETEEIVVPANYNCPGQLVISGTVKGTILAGAKIIFTIFKYALRR